MSAGVATTNLFALLSSENEDPQDLAAQLPVEKKPVAKPAAPEGTHGGCMCVGGWQGYPAASLGSTSIVH